MNIQDQFNMIAKEYDENRRRFIPCFDDYYVSTTDCAAKSLAKKPELIFDLGSGTGLLPSFWYPHFPDANYVLSDIAEEMISVAKKRFENVPNIKYEISDYSKKLPEGKPDLVLSALSIHHLEHEQKKSLFKMIHDSLSEGGNFVNYDQFCAGNEYMNARYDLYWENQLLISGLTENDISLWKERRKLDRECSVNDETDMLGSECYCIRC